MTVRAVAPRTWLLLGVLPAVAALVLSMLAGGGAPEEAPTGLPDAGPVTGWGSALTRLLLDLTAVATVGALLVPVLVPGAGNVTTVGVRALRAARWWAWGWAGCGLVLAFLTVSDVLGIPPGRLVGSSLLLSTAVQLPQVRGYLVVAGLAVVLGAYAAWALRRLHVWGLLALALATLVPPLYFGHAADSADHDLATSSLVVHVVGASLWVGGLFGLLWFLRSERPVLATALPRYSALALTCFVLVAGSGFLNAGIRSTDADAWSAAPGYLSLVLVKASLLVVLAAMGLLHRRATIPRLVTGSSAAFLRLATVELALMAAVVAVAVALSRTPSPASGQVTPAHGSGHPTLDADVAPFEPLLLLTTWRPDAVTLTVVGVATGWYALAVLRLRREGHRWPWRRSAAALCGATCAVLATSGGLAAYSTALFSAQVGQFLTLFVLVPVLVCLAGPVELSRESAEASGRPGRGALDVLLGSRAGRWTTEPLNALGIAIAALFGLYSTPLFDASLRDIAVHMLTNLAVLAAGLVFWVAVLMAEGTRGSSRRLLRVQVVLGLLAALALTGVRLLFADLLGGGWFVELGWEWSDPRADQRAAALALVVLPALAGPVLVWLAARTAQRAPAGPRPATDRTPDRAFRA